MSQKIEFVPAGGQRQQQRQQQQQQQRQQQQQQQQQILRTCGRTLHLPNQAYPGSECGLRINSR